MAGDFVNAIPGSVGETAGIIGRACATFLYNVKRGMDDIRRGDKRVVMVETFAPVQPHVIEGYRVMGALAEDEELMKLTAANIATIAAPADHFLLTPALLLLRRLYGSS